MQIAYETTLQETIDINKNRSQKGLEKSMPYTHSAKSAVKGHEMTNLLRHFKRENKLFSTKEDIVKQYTPLKNKMFESILHLES